MSPRSSPRTPRLHKARREGTRKAPASKGPRWASDLSTTVLRSLIAAASLCLAAVVVWPSAVAARTILYYAGETTEAAVGSPNYRALVATLEASSAPSAAGALKSLKIEAEVFPKLIDSDIAILRQQAVRLDADLLVFTNRLAAAGRYAAQTRDGWSERPFDVPPPASVDAVLEFAPLARVASLRAALDAAAKSTSARSGSKEIVLIVKAHGAETMAVMPRVVADLSRPGAAQELLARLDVAQRPDAERASWAQPKGITKIEFWQELRRAAERHGLRFSLVVLDSCRSGILTLDQYRQVPAEVDEVVHSGDEDIAFGQVDYAVAFRDAAAGVSPSAAIAIGFGKSGLVVEGPLKRFYRSALLLLEQIPVFLFFVPFALWVAWYFVRPRLLAVSR
jgi:hypothetical protein